ncbi:MAG: pseudouridine synthase [Bdellovibrionota bacterium]
MKIIFQNENFIAVDKESGVLTVPSRLGTKDDRPVLGVELQNQLKQQVFPVHRLDFEVSGLVLFSLNAKAHALASGWFEKKQVLKTYRAIAAIQNFDHWPENIPCARDPIDGPTEEPFLWKSRILRGKKRSFESPHGDLAETLAHLMVVDKIKNRAEWKLYPLTGRSHQLRFELSRHGFPIYGDQLYGSKIKVEGHHIALRATGISFKKIVGERLGLPENLNVPGEMSFVDDKEIK